MDAIKAEALEKRFATTVALDKVSFTIDQGELFGFIGPDGGGKTTLFRILVSLLTPDAGRAQVLGFDVVRDYRALRLRVGYMAGRFSLYPDLSVEENLTFFASVFGTTVEREYAQIEPIYAQLEPFRNRHAGALSGGMKQKLALCCALVHRPDVLFLDEPTTGVDAVSRREFWDLLGVLKQGGLTTVVSTPYMDEATRCDRVALMHRGKLLGLDAPSGIIAAFDRPLLGVHAAQRYKALLALRTYEHAQSAYPFGDVLHYTDARTDLPAEAIGADIKRFLDASGFSDASVEPLTPTVEDSFIARTESDPGSRTPDPGRLQ
ncbi:MAG TPA: ABC transporter ATP-binding protein [Vicinamibacterales bacterium]|jgi:ABC-2 type transport system ATP-binding protein|nr:ABC transporter ATP-binding protein [Vicinamibacterales bacterium]